jgi:hypothetical protein
MTDYVYKVVRLGDNGKMLSKATFYPYCVEYKLNEVSAGKCGSPLFVCSSIPSCVHRYERVLICEYGTILTYTFQVSTSFVELLTCEQMEELWSVNRNEGDLFKGKNIISISKYPHQPVLVDWVKPIEIISGEN